MKGKILFFLCLLVGVNCKIKRPNFNEGRDFVIRPIEETGKISLFISESGRELDLNDIINNPDPRVCDEIYIQGQPIENIRRVFAVYGAQVTKLDISNWDHVKYNAQDILDVINLLPKLESLEFSWFKEELLGEVVGTLNLPNLRKIILVDNSGKNKKIVIDFLDKVLPENLLTFLEIEDDQNYGKILSKQTSIKTLNYEGHDPTFNEAFNNLKLESLSCIISSSSSIDKEKFPERRKFLKAVIKSQPDVKHLTLVQSSDYLHEIVDDEVFQEIIKLSKIEDLKMSVDAITNLHGLQNLKNLKNLELKTNRDETVNLFNQFSTFKFDKLEKLTLNLFYFDISEATYLAMSQNMPNLKNLRITLGTRHKINFFARAFPQIEELNVRFGDSNHHFQFNQAFDGKSKDVQRNMKKIYFYFQGDAVIQSDGLIGLLKIFPNLEVLQIGSKFPYTTEFFTKISENLNNLKILKLSSITIDSFEEFPVATSNALKTLAGKLKYISIKFVNVHKVLFRNEKYNENFSYQPLINEIKNVFKYEEDGMSTIHSFKNLEIEAGRE